MDKKPIYVTRPLLPPLNEFIPYLQKIWDNKWLTNNGPFHQLLEKQLAEFLGVEHISLFTNGTIALITAAQALGLQGEVITTPYSFVATSHSLMWNNIKPVFVDIDPITLNINPAKIQRAITKKTTGILPVHCYGNPCDVEGIQRIASDHGLKIIYDAAHAFGNKYKGQSLLLHGDLSVLSFHATKVFNTFEGGAIISKDAAMKRRIDQLKNFGIVDEENVFEVGINGKMNEVQSAFGLLQIQHVNAAKDQRRLIDIKYRGLLSKVSGIRCLEPNTNCTNNYSYFPILIQSPYPLSRDSLYQRLFDLNFQARRYFYPLISNFPIYKNLSSADKNNLPVATSIALQALCLPIYPGLEHHDVETICNIICTP